MKNENKLNLVFISLISILLITIGTLVSLNSYGCLIYNKICIISSWHFPSCCWDQLSHIIGELILMILPFVLLYSVFSWLETKKIILPECLFWFTIIYLLVISCLILKFELIYETSKASFNFKALMFDFIGVILAAIVIWLIKGKFITPRPFKGEQIK
jgi:hypothetical protein